MVTTTFEYRGVTIRAEDDSLNLTDMWTAAGADPSRRPVEWLRSADAKRFVGFLEKTLASGAALEVGNSHFQLVRSAKGGRGVGGTTWAHWLIGMAYSEYLSEEFHVWCLTVVRDRMEGRLVPAGAVSLTETDFARLTDQTKQIVAPIVDGLNALSGQVDSLGGRVESLEKNLPQRRPILPKTKEAIVAAIIRLGRRCPCCGLAEVVTQDGAVIDAEFDHFFSNQLPSAKHAWLICKTCHRALTDGKMDRTEADIHFASFQRRLERLIPPDDAKSSKATRRHPS